MLKKAISVVKKISKGFDASIPSYGDVLKAEWKFYIDYLNPGMTVFDVGAYVGDFTWVFSQFVGGMGHVHAFEASGENYEKLVQLCQLMKLDNVSCEQTAVVDVSGAIDFYKYGDGYESWGSLAQRDFDQLHLDAVPAQQIERVPAITLDEYCSKKSVEFIDLLKIDVEGGELQALRGAGGLFRAKKIGCCLFEFGGTTFDMGNSPKEIIGFFDSVGYKLGSLIKGAPVFPGDSKSNAQFAMIKASPNEI